LKNNQRSSSKANTNEETLANVKGAVAAATEASRDYGDDVPPGNAAYAPRSRRRSIIMWGVEWTNA
jgi:hypothetical protein